MDIDLVLKIILCIATVLNFVILIINTIKTKKLTKQYDKALAKFNSHENIQDEFQTLYKRIGNVENISQETVNIVENFQEKMKSNVQKIGFVKYNAYDETENRLSFAIAMLDENENGILLNHIYSKHGSNIYAKLVTCGNVEDRISDEEAKALKIACEDKEFKQRKVEKLEKLSHKNKK